MTSTFNRQQQRHDAATPPEPRMCAPDSHEPTAPTVSLADLPNIVILVDCENCHASSSRVLEADDFEESWLL